VQSTEAEAATYDPRDQYMPYFLAGDPTMSDENGYITLAYHDFCTRRWSVCAKGYIKCIIMMMMM